VIDLDSFRQLAAQGHNRIPVVREVLSDLDTPLSVYLKLADGPHAYLFESVEGGETWGRYSIIGLPARACIPFAATRSASREHGEVVETREVADPLAESKPARRSTGCHAAEGLPAFTGGLVGYFGFETIGYIEPRFADADKPDQLGTPDALLMLSEEVAVFDNLKGRLYLIVHADPREPQAYAQRGAPARQLTHRLRHAGASYPEVLDPKPLDEATSFPASPARVSIAAVRRAQGLHPCRRHLPGGAVATPERAVPCATGGRVPRAARAQSLAVHVFSRPRRHADRRLLAGNPGAPATRHGHGAPDRRHAPARRARHEEDQALEAELLADPKERAEHLMLIDLGRNDVGRVAQTGSVQLTETLRDRALLACHAHRQPSRPASCADGLEHGRCAARHVPGRHGQRRAEDPRTGSHPRTGTDQAQHLRRCGRLHRLAGRCDTAIAIRTAVIQDGRLHVQAGAGIVHDSDPEKEWEETMNKGRALFRAVARERLECLHAQNCRRSAVRL
jgi:anthranilate synthase component 1